MINEAQGAKHTNQRYIFCEPDAMCMYCRRLASDGGGVGDIGGVDDGLARCLGEAKLEEDHDIGGDEAKYLWRESAIG